MPTIGIVGAGIIGAAVGRELSLNHPEYEITILEKESSAAVHQTGHNSGVVHAGLYYAPGSLKATLCQRGRVLIREYAAEKDLPYDEVGKVLVAGDAKAMGRLDGIEERARLNGVKDVRRLDAAELLEIEPLAVGIGGLHSPHTAITDYDALTRSFLDDTVERGGIVVYGAEVTAIESKDGKVKVTTSQGEYLFDRLVCCGGLQSDRLAAMAGVKPSVRIVPFRGKYYHLAKPETVDVRGLIYPVPDPKFPFLGVHVTRHIDGSVSVGPNAVLALDREEYRKLRIDFRDTASTLTWPGFYPLAAKNWVTGAKEMAITSSKHIFASQARKIFSGISNVDQMLPIEAGIRAQAVGRKGELFDEFIVEQHSALTFVLNAPSPAATSSMAIAEYLVKGFAA